MYIRWFLITFRRRSIAKNIIVSFFIIWFCYLFIKLVIESKNLSRSVLRTTTATIDNSLRNKRALTQRNDSEYRKHLFERKIKKLEQLVKTSRTLSFNEKSIKFPYYNVHTFYYGWYGDMKYDNGFLHWNHNYIPSWKKNDEIRIYRKHHEAPLDIGSNYYPALGCYSSRDPKVIETHLKQIKSAGIGVVVVSWTPPGIKDSPHDILPILFFYAKIYNIKITLHIEPYFNRNPENLRSHLKKFFDIYEKHPALYKMNITLTKSLPVLYIYDSYLTPFTSWRELLSRKGNMSVRGTKYDAVFIGLLVDAQHRHHIKKSNFDGFYTYFASNGFTYGSTWKNWNSLAKYARQNRLIFIPSVGPGYIDTQVRPWNSANTRHRRHGTYYDVAWRSAIASNVRVISITSFNEWHEGTQIEPAQSKIVTGFTYLDYTPEGSDFYLNLTKWWVDQFYIVKEVRNRRKS